MSANRERSGRRNSDPSYRRQREKHGADRAFVELDGKRHHLGDYGTDESRERYHRLLLAWRSGTIHRDGSPDDLSIVELCARFRAYADGYYRKADGTPTGEAANFAPVISALREACAALPVAEFGPIEFKAVRQVFIDRRNCRNVVNASMRRVRQIVKWGVGGGLVPGAVLEPLRAVAPLKRGRTEGVRETPKVRPVSPEHVGAIREHVSRQVGALIQLQLLTAGRPGELVSLRARDFDRSGDVWVYCPADHKGDHREHDRQLYFGPQAQDVLRPFLEGRPLDAPLFSPREAEQERLLRRRAERRTPLAHGNAPGRNRKRKPTRTPAEEYDVASYRRAIHRACERAGIPPWNPHRLRHSAGTEVRKRYGLEVSRAVLGHRSVTVSQIYAEQDAKAAAEVARRIG